MVSKAALAAGLVALIAAQVAAPAAWAATAPIAAPASAADATTVAPKVVIVVGPTESTTTSYRTDADSIAATALKYTPNVVKVYSPNATWAAVSAAAQGASIFVDLGHGWGFPSPYTTTLTPNSEDGMALNAAANQGDSNRQYYGESYIASSIRFAPGAVVFLNHLCYAPGESEPGNPDPTVAVAQQRVDNFASGYIRAGAQAVIADDGIGTVEAAITSIFTTHQSMLSAWRAMPDAQGHEMPWTPVRNPAFQAIIDPQGSTSGFFRSVVVDPAFTTDDVLSGAEIAAATPSLTAPGAASVPASTPVFTDQTLATSAGATLASGTTVRVDQLVDTTGGTDGSTAPTAAQVHTLNNATSGWVDPAALEPLNSTGPQLWSMTGSTTVSPNYDGLNDQLALWARLSESASWTAKVLAPDSSVLATASGTSDLFAIAWNGLIGGLPAPAGTYQWTIHATDALGNPALDATGDVTVVSLPVPAPSVQAFSTASFSRTASQAFQLVFSLPIGGLPASALTPSGTATGCVVGTPTGSGTTWSVPVSGCSAGTVRLTLAAGSVSNLSDVTGPASPAVSTAVLIDRTSPTATAPKPAFRSGLTLGSSLAVKVVWTGADAGSGVASYDVARSIDGASFSTIASGITAASLNTVMTPGHTYRYEARSRDRAGNVGAWVAGPVIQASLVQQTTTAASWSAGWTTLSSSSYSGGSARTATTAGSSVTYKFSGSAVAFVVARASTYGQVKVYVDGALRSTIDTKASTHGYRYVAYARSFSAGTHTLKLVVVGTAGRPRVVIDGFEVIH
ncbi:MAG TPA: hypothetical protein VFW20_06865 [Candidatus Limnocylindrales bacterium]|nr:hypothetical protein [Candidatus Limnocylindrales bacterium]